MADKTENKPGFVARAKAAVKNFFGNTDLLLILLVRIGMIGINDRCRILQILLLIHIQKSLAILIMVVWNRCTIFIHATPQDHMCQIIS